MIGQFYLPGTDWSLLYIVLHMINNDALWANINNILYE